MTAYNRESAGLGEFGAEPNENSPAPDPEPAPTEPDPEPVSEPEG